MTNRKDIINKLERINAILASKAELTKSEKLMTSIIGDINRELSTSTYKYNHRGEEVFEELKNVFGEESAYIYASMQVYKELYIYDYTHSSANYESAEFYKAKANELDKKLFGTEG